MIANPSCQVILDSSNEPKDRPALFKTEMVRATFADWKTQTRRLFKLPSGFAWYDELGGESKGWFTDEKCPEGWWHVSELGNGPACPYGVPGDRLWVREGWRFYGRERNGMVEGGVEYRTGESKGFREFPRPREVVATFEDAWRGGSVNKWKPSIHMPRWASRLTLEIKETRVERLQDISEADAKAEGLEVRMGDGTGPGAGFKWNGPGYWGGARGKFGKTYHVRFPWKPQCSCRVGEATAATCAFRELWESINGPEAWKANPWVWVVSFRRLSPDAP